MIKLIKNAEVFSSVGEKIGLLDRVVLNPSTKKVSHIIVKEGIVFSSSKVIPITYVDLDGERITINENAMELEVLPDFDESQYVTLDRVEEPGFNMQAMYWYPPVNIAWWSTGRQIWGPKPNYVLKKESILPEGTVALEEGAEVISGDGKDIGSIEQVIVETTEERATHIVVVRGLLSKERKIIPTLWIDDITDKKVYLHIDEEFFDHLPEYEALA